MTNRPAPGAPSSSPAGPGPAASAGPSTGQYVLLGMAVLGGLWAVLTPLLVFAPRFDPSGVAAVTGRVNAMDAGRLGEALAVLVPAALTGLVGLRGAQLLWRGASSGRWYLMAAATIMLVLTVFTVRTVGPFLFAPGLLFVFPALWLLYQPAEASPDKRASGRMR